MSELLDSCLIEINKYDETIRVDAIPKARKSYVDSWKLSTEIEVEKIRHDIDFYIGFPVEFPYTRPDFYFQSSEFGYLPHVESDNGKLCLDEDGSVFNTENPVAIIQECVRRAKKLIKAGAEKRNFADFLKEIESYWTREYDGEPNTRDSIIFYGKWPSEDCELNKLNYHVDQPEDAQEHFVINSLLYIGYNEPFDGYISKHFQHELRKVLFLNNVYIRETAPYNLTFEDFLSLLTESGKKLAIRFLNKYNGGDIYFKLTDNRIAGISFGKANLHMNGFRTLKPCYVYENFGNKKKNLQRLFGFVYTRERAAERTSGTLKTPMNFLVVGLGSIGSNLVHFLLGYNSTSFTLVDMDVLTVDNIGRHVLGLRYVNLSKVHGMADYIKASDIEANVKPIASTLQEYIGGNFNQLNSLTAIFLCVGDVMTERYVYQAVIEGKLSVPIFNLWLEPFGVGGHMVYVNPTDKTSVFNIYEEKTYRYVYNIVKSEEYDIHGDMFVQRDAGCNGAYALYSQNDVMLMLSAFYPIINKLLDEPSQSKCYRWVGNIEYLQKKRHKSQGYSRYKGRNSSRVSSIIINTCIEVTQESVDALKSHIQMSGNEDCGVIMGSVITENLIRVNKISNSLCKSQSAKTCCCVLDRVKANFFIHEDYEHSNHTRVYIGEWHTHPENFPSPSSVDVSSIKESFKRNDRALKGFILMAIVGREDIYWGFYDGIELKRVYPTYV